ncbi:MAG: hypothetical protein KBH23_01370 [Bacteroidaceae bacterium]|nr:hypothetical protein [Bacteroidaceae bacterium]
MKRFPLLLLLLVCSIAVAQGQDRLNIERFFSHKYRNSHAIMVEIKGEQLEAYRLSLYKSLEIKQQQGEVNSIEQAVQADAKSACRSQEVRVAGKIVSAYYQLSPIRERGPNRFILLRKETNDTAVLIYLEGYTELKKLIQIFLNKKN